MYPRNPLRLPNDVLSRFTLRLPSSAIHLSNRSHSASFLLPGKPPVSDPFPPPLFLLSLFSHNTSPVERQASLRYILFYLSRSVLLPKASSPPRIFLFSILLLFIPCLLFFHHRSPPPTAQLRSTFSRTKNLCRCACWNIHAA